MRRLLNSYTAFSNCAHKSVLLLATCSLLWGCATVTSLSTREPYDPAIYSGVRYGFNSLYDEPGFHSLFGTPAMLLALPFNFAADTIVLPITIPLAAYDSVFHPWTENLEEIKLFNGTSDYLLFLRIGENEQIYLKYIFLGGLDKKRKGATAGTTYISDDENIVSVDGNGLATAKGAGTTNITVRAGNRSLIVQAIVKPKK